MAEGLFRENALEGYEAISAGTQPSGNLNPHSIQVMREISVILAIVHTKGLKGFSGIAIVGIIGLDIFFFAFISGASVNPARSLAPAPLSGVLTNLWIYWSATFVGTPILAFILKKYFDNRKNLFSSRIPGSDISTAQVKAKTQRVLRHCKTVRTNDIYSTEYYNHDIPLSGQYVNRS